MTKIAETHHARTLADSLGFFGSALCALHCLALPTMLVLGTTIPASLLDDAAFHDAILSIILPSALCAFCLGCKIHKDTTVLVFGVIGLVGIWLSAAMLHDVLGESGERAVNLISAAVLMSAHYRNFKLCRSNSCQHENC